MIRLQKDFIFKFFQEFTRETRDLEAYVNGDNVLRVQMIILKMKKMLSQFMKDYEDALRDAIMGGK